VIWRVAVDHVRHVRLVQAVRESSLMAKPRSPKPKIPVQIGPLSPILDSHDFRYPSFPVMDFSVLFSSRAILESLKPARRIPVALTSSSPIQGLPLRFPQWVVRHSGSAHSSLLFIGRPIRREPPPKPDAWGFFDFLPCFPLRGVLAYKDLACADTRLLGGGTE
jgi:hypothetical protein